jgi:cytochrome b561
MVFWGDELMAVERGRSLAGWRPAARASFGVLVLLLTVARLAWRACHAAPKLPMDRRFRERKASHLSRGAF